MNQNQCLNVELKPEPESGKTEEPEHEPVLLELVQEPEQPEAEHKEPETRTNT